jgi:hypothetical protein
MHAAANVHFIQKLVIGRFARTVPLPTAFRENEPENWLQRSSERLSQASALVVDTQRSSNVS